MSSLRACCASLRAQRASRKGHCIRIAGTVLSALATGGGNGWGLSANDVVLGIPGFFHCNGWAAPFLAPMYGAKLVLPGRRADDAWLHRLIVDEGVTIAAAVPTIWLGILEYCRTTGQGLGALRRIFSGGTAPPAAMIESYLRDYGVRVSHGWGMTETTHGATISFARHDLSDDAAVVAMQHPRWQERPFLIVVLMENAAVTIDDLRTHLLQFMPRWWLPDAIAFAAELPHGPTGKIQKDELRQRVSDGEIVPITAPTTAGSAAPPPRTARHRAQNDRGTADDVVQSLGDTRSYQSRFELPGVGWKGRTVLLCVEPIAGLIAVALCSEYIDDDIAIDAGYGPRNRSPTARRRR